MAEWWAVVSQARNLDGAGPLLLVVALLLTGGVALQRAASRGWTLPGKVGTSVQAAMPVATLLLWELFVPGNWGWNVALALMLAGFGAAAFFIHRYLSAHASEVGEARFDTTNRAGRS